jgi:hypothetical protein
MKEKGCIKYKVTIFYKDDTEKTFDCVFQPRVNQDWVAIDPNYGECVYIPTQAVAQIKYKEYWYAQK